jgi:ubiquinone/menaquinone biosynthesis C-methylase UbiE
MDPMRMINELAPATRDERSRQHFVSSLRKYVMADMSRGMRGVYEDKVKPAWVAREGQEPQDGREVRKAMMTEPYYQAWSALRYNAQEMTWDSVQGQVERNLPGLVEAARETRDGARGSLRLDPDVEIPKAVTSMDIHLMPGCFHLEFGDDDVAQGAVYELGSAVFAGGLKFKSRGSVAESMAHFIRVRYPDFKPRRILDLGCTAGANTLPYAEVFPEAEVHGIDIGAALLRYGHARAEWAGLPVHFSQQNAEHTDFPDGHFDLVVSSFFLHEQSTKSTRQIFREINRLLSPGGLMLHMELPPSAVVDPYYNFYLDWDAYYNNEPHYRAFRAMDFPALCAETGFEPDRYVQVRVANFPTTPLEEFEAVARGEKEAPAHGNGASWFLFGAWK